MNEYKFKFSVIIPIYNVEKYLEETILSVINQTIGFKENIQLILINDGSKDKSYKICEKYKKLYSDNIIYDKQENQGVSAARNKGMEYIEGKYANFLDSDDIWDLDVFEKVYKFFEKHEKDIDVISCRQKFFEAKEGYHQLDYKFESNRIIDIQEDFEYIQLSTSSAFLKSDIVKKYKYDERLKYAEDATLVEIRNKLSIGDDLEILVPGELEPEKFEIVKLYDSETNQSLETINPGKRGQTVKISIPFEVKKGWILRRKK